MTRLSAPTDMPNLPGIEAKTTLRTGPGKTFPRLTAKSAGLAMVGGALSAVLMAIPLAMSHSFLAAQYEKSSLAGYFKDRSIDGPRLMVWSWQHNDDLSYLDTAKVGVAYLVGRFVLKGESLTFERSFSQTQLPVGIYREAAIRLECWDIDQTKIEKIADTLSGEIVARALQSPARIAALQIDFDARLNERKFYTLLLHKIRTKLPSSIKLSMTALASWCLGDNWLSAARLPVDEIVPMLFSLGLDKRQVKKLLISPNTLYPKLFSGRLSPGLSINEAGVFTLLGDRLAKYRRLYLFSSTGWKRGTFEKAQNLLLAGHSAGRIKGPDPDPDPDLGPDPGIKYIRNVSTLR